MSRQRIEERLTGVKRVAEFLEPYDKAYPGITIGRALRLECAAIAAAAPPGGVSPFLTVKQLSPRTFTVVHIPTDRLIGRYRTRFDADEFIRRVSHLDWNFHDPYGSPILTLKTAWPIFAACEMGLFRKASHE